MAAPLLVFTVPSPLAFQRTPPAEPGGVIWPVAGAICIESLSFVTPEGIEANDDGQLPNEATQTQLGYALVRHPSLLDSGGTTACFRYGLTSVLADLLPDDDLDEMDAMQPDTADLDEDYAILGLRDGYAWIGQEAYDHAPLLDLHLFAPSGFTDEGLAKLANASGITERRALLKALERVVVAVRFPPPVSSVHALAAAHARFTADLRLYKQALACAGHDFENLAIVTLP